MNLSKVFGTAFASGVLDCGALPRTEDHIDHPMHGPARFWADPPPG